MAGTERGSGDWDRRGLFVATALTALAGPCVLAAQEAAAGGKPKLTVLPAQWQWTLPPAQAPAREGHVDAGGGVRLYYWDTGGTGEPVVLMHPATGSADVWGYQQPVFVGAGYRVIAFSRRSHRGSDTGPLDARGTAADDLLALLNALRIDRCHLVGSAAGGGFCPDFALSHPDRVRTITIACSLGGVNEASLDTLEQPPQWSSLPETFKELGPSYRGGFRAGVALWDELQRNSLSGSERIRQPNKNRMTWASVAKITTPALCMGGAADLYMSVPQVLEYGRRFPNSEIVILSESGHSGYWEQPIAFNGAVLDFIGRHRI